jgi:DNA-binding Lrp family transcriptional regulator
MIKRLNFSKPWSKITKSGTRTLAMMLNISEKEVEEMIKELEEKKVILGYLTLIDWEKTGNNGTVTAIIDVQVTPQRDVGFDVIAERICRFPEVKSVTLMSGVTTFR